MKKVISLLLTIAVLVTSMFTVLVPAVSAATDTTSAEALAESLGATDEKLILSELSKPPTNTTAVPPTSTRINLLMVKTLPK